MQIPGSRTGWGLVFFSSLFGLSLLIYEVKKPVKIVVDKRDLLLAIVAFGFGSTVAELMSSDIFQSVLIGGAGCSGGFLLSSRRWGLSYLIAGSVMGCLFSCSAGFILGNLVWFYGDERNILVLVLGNTYNGFRLGLFFGPLGVIMGALVVLLYKRKVRQF